MLSPKIDCHAITASRKMRAASISFLALVFMAYLGRWWLSLFVCRLAWLNCTEAAAQQPADCDRPANLRDGMTSGGDEWRGPG
jgi:hypothetical protein